MMLQLGMLGLEPQGVARACPAKKPKAKVKRGRRPELAQLIPLSWRPESAVMRALCRHGINAEDALARYIQAMLSEKVVRKRWVRRSFVLWVERALREGRLSRGRPEPPEPGEEGLDELLSLDLDGDRR